MNGHILKGSAICVDYWLWTPEKKYIHFLSHLHSAQTYKLSSTFRGTIYTSPFNAWLVKQWFQVPEERVVPLTLDEPHILPDGKGGFFNVTLIDANHCPGSVMFLFEGSFGNILYTGDFRYTLKMLKNPMLKSLIDNKMVQDLYIDNTFAAEHCRIPSQEEALQQVIDLVKMHPDHYIVIGVKRIGKEEVLTAVAKELKEKILVSVERMAILKRLQFANVFTTNSQESRILAKEIHLITGKFIFRLKEEKGPVLTILLTALHSIISSYQPESKIKEDQLLGIHRVPYSDHSSHQELVTFVSRVKPLKIHPILCTTKDQNVAVSKREQADVDQDVLELSLIWNCHKIPESISKLCLANKRKSNAQSQTPSGSCEELISSEEDSTQRTEEVSGEEFKVGSSHMTEDLSNEIPQIRTEELSGEELIVGSSHMTQDLSNKILEIQFSQVDSSHNSNNSLFSDLHPASQPIMDTIITDNDKEEMRYTVEQRSNKLSKDSTITNTEEEMIKNIFEQQPTKSEQLKMEKSVINTEEEEIYEQCDKTIIQRDEESDFISLSQEDLTQITTQQSNFNVTDPNHNPSSDQIYGRKTKLKKIMILDSGDSDSSDLNFQNVNFNHNKEGSLEYQSDTFEENCESNEEKEDLIPGNAFQISTKGIQQSAVSDPLQNRTAITKDSDDIVEICDQKYKSVKRKSIGSDIDSNPNPEELQDCEEGEETNQFTEIGRCYTSFETFEEMDVFLKENDFPSWRGSLLKKRVKYTTPEPREVAKPGPDLDSSCQGANLELSTDSSLARHLDLLLRNHDENTPENIEEVRDYNASSNDDDDRENDDSDEDDSNGGNNDRDAENSDSNHDNDEYNHNDSGSELTYEADLERFPQESEDDRLLNLHSPVSSSNSSETYVSSREEEEDLTCVELVKNIVFYQDLLAKKLGGIRLSANALYFIANHERILAQWEQKIEEIERLDQEKVSKDGTENED